jgi:hypothetical protein
VIDGDLAHVDRHGNQHPNEYSPEHQQLFHAQLAWIAKDRGYKPGWAAHKFKERFGHWPERRDVLPLRPRPEVLAWERHCRIRYAKSMQKAVGNA